MVEEQLTAKSPSVSVAESLVQGRSAHPTAHALAVRPGRHAPRAATLSPAQVRSLERHRRRGHPWLHRSPMFMLAHFGGYTLCVLRVEQAVERGEAACTSTHPYRTRSVREEVQGRCA